MPRDHAKLDVAAGSGAETRYLMNVSARLGYVEAGVVKGFDDAADRLLRSLNRLRQTLAPDRDENAAPETRGQPPTRKRNPD